MRGYTTEKKVDDNNSAIHTTNNHTDQNKKKRVYVITSTILFLSLLLFLLFHLTFNSEDVNDCVIADLSGPVKTFNVSVKCSLMPQVNEGQEETQFKELINSGEYLKKYAFFDGLAFDAHGMITGNGTYDVTREDNRITSLEYKNINYSFSYTETGFVSEIIKDDSETKQVIKNKYDNQGFIKEQKIFINGNLSKTRNFEVLNVDNYGNWTRRYVYDDNISYLEDREIKYHSPEEPPKYLKNITDSIVEKDKFEHIDLYWYKLSNGKVGIMDKDGTLRPLRYTC